MPCFILLHPSTLGRIFSSLRKGINKNGWLRSTPFDDVSPPIRRRKIFVYIHASPLSYSCESEERRRRRSSETYGIKWIGRFSIRGYRFEKNLSRSQRLNPLHFSKPPSSRSVLCKLCCVLSWIVGNLNLSLKIKIVRLENLGRGRGRNDSFVSMGIRFSRWEEYSKKKRDETWHISS